MESPEVMRVYWLTQQMTILQYRDQTVQELTKDWTDDMKAQLNNKLAELDQRRAEKKNKKQPPWKSDPATQAQTQRLIDEGYKRPTTNLTKGEANKLIFKIKQLKNLIRQGEAASEVLKGTGAFSATQDYQEELNQLLGQK